MNASARLDAIARRLDAVGSTPPPSKRNLPPTKREVIFALAPRIETMLRGDRKKRWTHRDICEWLSGQGVTVSLKSFDKYLREYRRQAKGGC